jgi:hypothetical protein
MLGRLSEKNLELSTRGHQTMEKRARGRPSGGGSKLQRTETVTLRLDPRLRYLTELAARKQRRTVSSFIEWAIEQTLSLVQLPPLDDTSPPIDLVDASTRLWDPDEADRFAKLGFYYPDLLTYDEQVLWKLIQECEALWLVDFDKRNGFMGYQLEEWLLYPALRKHWEALKKVANGEADISMLPEPEEARESRAKYEMKKYENFSPQ